MTIQAMEASQSRRAAVILNRVRWITSGFWLLFFSYASAQLLQTSINGSSGYLCLSLVYYLFAGSALFAPWIISIVPPHILIPLSAMPYVLMVASNMSTNRAGLLVGCASVGVGAATLWSAHGTYITEASVAYSHAAGIPLAKAASIVNAAFYTPFFLSNGMSCLLTSVLFLVIEPREILFVLFLFLTMTGSCGLLVLASMSPAAAEGDTVFVLPFASIVAAARGGWLWLMTPRAKTAPLSESIDAVDAARLAEESMYVSEPGVVPGKEASTVVVGAIQSSASEMEQSVHELEAPVDDSSGAVVEPEAPSCRAEQMSPELSSASPPAPSVISSGNAVVIRKPPPPTLAFLLRFLMSDARMRLLAAPIISVGACMGLVNTLWYASVVAGGPGIAYLGFVGAVLSLASTGAAWLWGFLVMKPRVGRRVALACAAALQVTFLGVSAVWVVVTDNSNGGHNPPLGVNLSVVFALAAVYGMTEGIFITYSE